MAIEIQPETERPVGEVNECEHFVPAAPKPPLEAVAHIRSIRVRNELPPDSTIRGWIDEGRD